MDDFSGLGFYWNPETNVSQYEHPNPPPPPPPHPPPNYYQLPYEYKPTFPSADCTYRPPDYPASYMSELPVAPSYTSPIFLPTHTPPFVTYFDSIDVPQIPNSYAANPYSQDPRIYNPSLSYDRYPWFSNSEQHLQFPDPPQLSPHELDLVHDSAVQPIPLDINGEGDITILYATSPAAEKGVTVKSVCLASLEMSLNSVRATKNLAVVSHVRMKRKAPSVSFCQRRYRNSLIPSFFATPSLSSVPTSQPQEHTSPTNIDARTPITIRKGPDKHMPIPLRQPLNAKTVAMVVLLHKRKTMTVSGHKWGRRVQDLKPFFLVRQRRAKWKHFDKGRSFQQSKKDIRHSNVLTLVGDQPWAALYNLQSNAVQLFDGMPKRRIKVSMPNFLILNLMKQFKSGLDINEYISYVLRALRAIRMLSFPFDEGGVLLLQELKIVDAMFKKVCELTERSIEIVSDRLSIVDITVLSPVSLVLTFLALELNNFHGTRPPMCHPPHWLYGWVASRCCLLGYGLQILTAVFLPFEDFYIISRHFQTVSSKENMRYHFMASCTVDFVLMPLMTHTHILSYEDIILALTFAYWSLEAMHLCRVIATSFHQSGIIESYSTMIALYLHLKPVEKFVEIFENMWISWITQLIGRHHKEALNMEYLFNYQRLLHYTAVQSQNMRYCFCPNLSTDYSLTEMQSFFHALGLHIYEHEPYHISIVGIRAIAATYIIFANQRHVCRILHIDSTVLRTAFDNHWDSEECVTWCHFNVTCNVDLMAALFETHTTHLHLMKMYFSGPTTSMSPTHVLPPVTTFVHGLLFHLHKHELDHILVGMITQVATTLLYWLNVDVVFVAKWVGKQKVFIPLFTWSEVLSRNFVLADFFHHHDKARVTSGNMRDVPDFGRWFSLVYKEFITNGWKFYFVRHEWDHNTLLIALTLVSMIHILYGEGVQLILSRGGHGSNTTEWMSNYYLIHFFTYTVQSNESVIWFFTSSISFTVWIKLICSVVYQMTNPFGGVPKCFDYWKGLGNLALFFHYKKKKYGMSCAYSLLYLRNYPVVQFPTPNVSSQLGSDSYTIGLHNTTMEFVHGWKISSDFICVWLSSLTNLGVFLIAMVSLSLHIFRNWVCNLLEHLFMTTNSDLTVFSATSGSDHPLGFTDPQYLNANIGSCQLMATIGETWTPAALLSDFVIENCWITGNKLGLPSAEQYGFNLMFPTKLNALYKSNGCRVDAPGLLHPSLLWWLVWLLGQYNQDFHVYSTASDGPFGKYNATRFPCMGVNQFLAVNDQWVL